MTIEECQRRTSHRCLTTCCDSQLQPPISPGASCCGASGEQTGCPDPSQLSVLDRTAPLMTLANVSTSSYKLNGGHERPMTYIKVKLYTSEDLKDTTRCVNRAHWSRDPRGELLSRATRGQTAESITFSGSSSRPHVNQILVG
ncbi:uncharacterized protein LOC124267146 [Haliotis rubra]|uniref:uncharacterized protein LOC124267146 n=1 Tax=Haliotis rubra TaxID=36100 RepID=UPI001EE565AB|nr:uncharacterized protein LOC124267146 [Haliotis rubra]